MREHFRQGGCNTTRQTQTAPCEKTWRTPSWSTVFSQEARAGTSCDSDCANCHTRSAVSSLHRRACLDGDNHQVTPTRCGDFRVLGLLVNAGFESARLHLSRPHWVELHLSSPRHFSESRQWPIGIKAKFLASTSICLSSREPL